MAYVFITVAFVRMLYRKQKEVPPMQRTRLRALLLAIVGLWIFGTNDLMPIWAWTIIRLTHVNFYPLGSSGGGFLRRHYWLQRPAAPACWIST